MPVAKLMGFGQTPVAGTPVGEIIRWDGKPHRVVGVVKDLVIESPYQPIQPCIFLLEIGVRKVLGASVLNLWGLLSKDFVVGFCRIGCGRIAHYGIDRQLPEHQSRPDEPGEEFTE